MSADRAFYNEIDQQCCAWLSNLMDAGLITPGVICDRSIEDITPRSLLRYDRVHMFAGIAGWELALNLAGWRHEPGVRVWTGSAPCQPFSAAGKGDGFADQRHLWPAWFHLIRQCKPGVVFGEQVASAIRHGWLDLVSADLEAEGYAVGASVLGAHSVGAPHIRQRLYWMADSTGARRRARKPMGERAGGEYGRSGAAIFMGDTSNPRSQGHGRPVEINDPAGRQDAGRHSAAAGFWSGEWRTGADGKARLVESGIEPLAHGVPGRVVKLRAYGNAICPQTAAAFIAAHMAGESAVELAA